MYVALGGSGALMASRSVGDRCYSKSLRSTRQTRVVRVGSDPVAMAFTPNSKTVYVVNQNSGTVTPIALGPKKAGPCDHRRW